MALNGYVHYRVRSDMNVSWHWAFALSALDVMAITAGLVISSGFENDFYVLYYPCPRRVRGGVRVVQAQLRLGHHDRHPLHHA